MRAIPFQMEIYRNRLNRYENEWSINPRPTLLRWLEFAAMSTLESETLAILKGVEANLKGVVVLEGEDLQYFEDPAIDFLISGMFAIKDRLAHEIPQILERKISLADLPELATCGDIFELDEALEPHAKDFPLLLEFIEPLDKEDVLWQPLFDALRDYFTAERIAEIEEVHHFNLAVESFLLIKELSYDHLSGGKYDELRPNVSALQESYLATFNDLKELRELAELLTRMNYKPPTPVPQVFQGSTGGLEPRFIEWLEKHIKSDSLFDDEDFDLLATDIEVDPDWELLLSRWLERDIYQKSSFENYIWAPTDVRAPIDYEFDDKQVFFEIHELDQILRDPMRDNLGHLAEDMPFYKIIMYRTGERHEYDSVMDASLLALQVLLFQQSSEAPIENIEGEIYWIRLKEQDYPLLGLSINELDDLSQTFLNAQ